MTSDRQRVTVGSWTGGLIESVRRYSGQPRGTHTAVETQMADG
jgi:hypothetical protein